MKRIILAAALALTGSIAQAGAHMEGIVKLEASGTVAEVIDRLEAAVEGAGATVFARVDHAGGAQKVDMELRPMQLLIFGNPKIGTPALQDAAMLGLQLPLRVLAWEDAEGVWIAYEDPAAMVASAGGDLQAEYVTMMAGALEKLTAAAARQ